MLFHFGRAMALDSKAAFRQRAVEAAIPDAEIDALAAGGIETFAQFAFCTSYQPGTGSDDALFDHLKHILGAKPTGAKASHYRRLFFESHSLALKDLHLQRKLRGLTTCVSACQVLCSVRRWSRRTL